MTIPGSKGREGGYLYEAQPLLRVAHTKEYHRTIPKDRHVFIWSPSSHATRNHIPVPRQREDDRVAIQSSRAIEEELTLRKLVEV